MASTVTSYEPFGFTALVLATPSKKIPPQSKINVCSWFNLISRQWVSFRFFTKSYALVSWGNMADGFSKLKFSANGFKIAPIAAPPSSRDQVVLIPSKIFDLSSGKSPFKNSRYSVWFPREPVLPKPCDLCILRLSDAISPFDKPSDG